MIEFLHWLQGTMSVPTWFGWYHILWLLIMIAECVVIYIFRNKISKKTINIILLTAGIALIVFEVYKQIVFSFNYNGGGGEFGMVVSMVCLSVSVLLHAYVSYAYCRHFTQRQGV